MNVLEPLLLEPLVSPYQQLTLPFPSTPLAKETRRRSIIAQLEPRTRALAYRVAEVMRAEFRAVITRLAGRSIQKIVPGGLIPDPYRLASNLMANTVAFLSSVVNDFGESSMREVSYTSIDWNLYSPDAVEWIRTKPMKFSEEVARDVVDELRVELEEGYAIGETFSELQTRVQHVFDDTIRGTAGRALRVARTEVHSAANFGIQEGFIQAGVRRKEWVSFPGARPAHAEARGQVVDLSVPFIVGGEALMYPGDPNGTPGNIINCRCLIGALL